MRFPISELLAVPISSDNRSSTVNKNLMNCYINLIRKMCNNLKNIYENMLVFMNISNSIPRSTELFLFLYYAITADTAKNYGKNRI